MYQSKPKRNEALLDASDSVLVIIDVQERFRFVINEMQMVIDNCSALCKAAVRLNIPILISEQSPEKLGSTVSEILDAAGEEPFTVGKKSFSAVIHEEFYEKLKSLKKKYIIIAGVETHVCVQQTSLDLVANFDGWITVVADAVSSRKKGDRELAFEKMKKQGVVLSTLETVLFEWVVDAGAPEFKDIQKLIK